MAGRVIAIGDIHGCSLALSALMDAIEPQPEDTVVTLGDYVNKGADSKGALDLLLDMEARCRLVPLLGNHDAVMLAAVEGRLSVEAWRTFGGDTVLLSYGESARPDDIPECHVEILQRCQLWHETATHFFVHAAYDPEIALPDQDETTLLWEGIRDGVPARHCSGKTAVVGHTSQADGEVLNAGHLVCIDTCCHGGGWLTAMDVGSGQVWQADRNGAIRLQGE